MKKILYLHSGAELYGADQILLKIVGGIDKAQYKPIVVLPNDGPLVKKLNKLNIETRILEYPIVRRQFFTLKGIINYMIEYKKSCKRIIKIVNDEDIDIIHSNTIAVLEGIYIKKKTKKKLIIHVHEMLEKPKIVAKVLYKLAVKKADKVIVVSNAVKKHIEQFVKNKKDNIVVIHNGIETDIYNNSPETEYLYNEFNIPKNSIVVGMIGRVNAIKGQNDFIEAMSKIVKQNQNVYGLIVGDAFPGQEWRITELKEKISELGVEDRIIYTGFRNDIPNIQNMLDIFVLPSVQKDSFPTVVLEAMASSTPIVAYKCGGVEEMVEDGKNGFLVELRNRKMLALKLNEIIQNVEVLKTMQNKSREIVNEKFSINTFIKNIENTYDSME